MKKVSKEHVLKDYNKLKKVAQKYTQRNNYEKALRTIFVAAGFMYNYSQIYFDDEMEQLIKKIGNNLHLNISKQKDNHKKIMFYDGFGNDRRGLALIYLRALKNLDYDIVYVTYQKFSGTINEISKLLEKQEIIYLKEKSVVKQIYELNNIINQNYICQVLLYMCPDDVVATTVFSQYEGLLERYLVNLTDHAFWLGKGALDYVIEYREYGADISFFERNISQKQILYLPYYPNIQSKEFKGFPFEDAGKKIVFSGGALYKTFDKENTYYKIVRRIVQTNEDVIFYYVGNGDKAKLKQLKDEFPERIFYENEREDFYEIMKRCYVYLSTYPYTGGLMSQYAICAGKIPITLKKDSFLGEEMIRNLSKCCFDNEQDLLKAICEMIQDKDVLDAIKKEIVNDIILPHSFKEKLENILDKKEKGFRDKKWVKQNINKMQSLIIERSTIDEYWGFFCRVKAPFLVYVYPMKFMLGFLNNITGVFLGKLRIKRVKG